ncbi:hypothetical protein KIH74_16175 [Kineosporia sp. J2-2]|uniref:Uncharacterized protein n=1 Tax=Kineosporia corallincola TaxID=2835133 RepID=A0ABS5THB4_9ACTN|nr:hypothetical protein [Kineosporia corallincola]MBT0770482.1 hypothetical protein [Kineosporia corallincola]
MSTDAIKAWFGARLPAEWNEPAAEVTTDREEILVRLTVPAPEGVPALKGVADEPEKDDAAAAARAEAIAGGIARFRDETRDRRIQVAREAEHRFGRKVAWAVTCGGETEVFTSLAVPVMTRLRQPERLVLDTLVEAGVARSRAHALAWCVRLVGDNTSTWLTDLRSAMEAVEKVRRSGPAN